MLKSFKIFGNHFGQQSLGLFYKLFTELTDVDYYPDFLVLIEDDEFQVAILETMIDFDIYV